MSRSSRRFELLDIPKFGLPNIAEFDVARSAAEITRQLGEDSFMSYTQVWSRLERAANGELQSDSLVDLELSSYKAAWKNENLRFVLKAIRDILANRGTWYPNRQKPVNAYGINFKPSTKGVWFTEGSAYSVLINARKSQQLSELEIRFLARGIYEIDCRDDPNDPVPLIIDLSANENGVRQVRLVTVPVESAMPLEEFESILDSFVESLVLSGFAATQELGEPTLLEYLRRGRP